MSFQPAQDAVLVEYKFSSLNGYTWQNNLHFTKPGFNAAEQLAFANALAGAWAGGLLRDHMSVQSRLDSIKVTDLRTEGAPTVEVVMAVMGEDASDLMAPSTGLVLTLRTALRGRSYRGRVYLGGIGEARWATGDWEAFTVGEAIQWLEAIQALADALGWTLVVLSRWHNHLERAIALGQAVIDIVSRSERAGSQRRRNQRG